MARLVRALVLVAVAALGLLLHLRNPQPVTFDFLLGAIEGPLSLLLAGAMAVGAVLGMLSALAPLVALKRENWRLRREARPLRPNAAQGVKSAAR